MSSIPLCSRRQTAESRASFNRVPNGPRCRAIAWGDYIGQFPLGDGAAARPVGHAVKRGEPLGSSHSRMVTTRQRILKSHPGHAVRVPPATSVCLDRRAQKKEPRANRRLGAPDINRLQRANHPSWAIRSNGERVDVQLQLLQFPLSQLPLLQVLSQLPPPADPQPATQTRLVTVLGTMRQTLTVICFCTWNGTLTQ